MRGTLTMSEHITPDAHRVEGIARVVSIEGAVAWLEPEQTTSCGSCASSATCGAKGIGTVASRMEARRFPLDNEYTALTVGERVVVGVDDRSLVKASLLAYAIPLVAALSGGGIAQALYGSDLISLLSMVSGLLLGLLLARLGASHLTARGELSPRFLRRARPDESCDLG